MNPQKPNTGKPTLAERLLAPLAFLTGNPTNPQSVPLSQTPPQGLALVYSAASAAEADLIRQTLLNAQFHVEFVPPATTGIFGPIGSPDVYVHAGEEQEARQFLHQLQQTPTDQTD